MPIPFLALAPLAPLAPLALVQTPDLHVAQSAPAVLVDNYDLSLPSLCTGMPLGSGCHATLVGIYYPDGKGPDGLGYPEDAAPVLIALRGGNANPEAPVMLPWSQTHVLPHGFVAVDPNYPPVKLGEDYDAPAASIGYLIQYLRYYSDWLNIDPNRIFVFGRSFGGFMSLTVSLKEDHQDLASPDPIEHLSSRPDFSMPFSALTDWTCFGPVIFLDFYLQTLFPVAASPGATLQQKLDDSPVYWLANPQLYGRTSTPPICGGYLLGAPLPCGQLTDPHDGKFGIVMRDAIDVFAQQTADANLGLSSHLIDSTDLYALGGGMDMAMDWAVKQLSPKVETLYLVPPKTPIGPTGSFQALDLIGAPPGALVIYFAGFISGSVVVPGCPLIQQGLLDFFPLGARVADAQGKTSLSVFVPPQAVGIDVLLHAASFQGCSVSNLVHKKWTD